MTVARVGGRVLLVDASQRLLLIHERLEHGGTHWLTPGGGVEDGEHPRDAARRETIEETGIEVDLPADAEAVLTTRRDWSWAGVDYDQVDHFFLARVAGRARRCTRGRSPRSSSRPGSARGGGRSPSCGPPTRVLGAARLGDVLAALLPVPGGR